MILQGYSILKEYTNWMLIPIISPLIHNNIGLRLQDLISVCKILASTNPTTRAFKLHVFRITWVYYHILLVIGMLHVGFSLDIFISDCLDLQYNICYWHAYPIWWTNSNKASLAKPFSCVWINKNYFWILLVNMIFYTQYHTWTVCLALYNICS